MSIFAVIMVAIGLSMDACAVSFAKGMGLKKNIGKYALLFGVFFGLFQGLMPLCGWWIGTYFESMITAIDHWIAFFLLSFIGINMIRESREEKSEESASSISFKTVIILSIATSIDAFAVGISFAFLQVDIVSAALSIGLITFVISFIAVYLGNKIGGVLGKYAEVLGGVILIFIGLKILIEHLFLN